MRQFGLWLILATGFVLPELAGALTPAQKNVLDRAVKEAGNSSGAKLRAVVEARFAEIAKSISQTLPELQRYGPDLQRQLASVQEMTSALGRADFNLYKDSNWVREMVSSSVPYCCAMAGTAFVKSQIETLQGRLAQCRSKMLVRKQRLGERLEKQRQLREKRQDPAFQEERRKRREEKILQLQRSGPKRNQGVPSDPSQTGN